MITMGVVSIILVIRKAQYEYLIASLTKDFRRGLSGASLSIIFWRGPK